MKSKLFNNIQIHKLSNSFTNGKCFVDVLRLDLIHPIVSGNKFFKLRYYIEEAKNYNKKIITFGGAFSNHIVATAFACKQTDIPCKAFIRGEQPKTLSATLQNAIEFGMDIEFVNRNTYKDLAKTLEKNNNELIIPEGGFGQLGCKGAATINHYINNNYNYIITAVGTGTTIAGLSENTKAKVIGINVLKGNENQTLENIKMLQPNHNVALLTNYHFGGYAKKNKELLQFMNWLYSSEKIPTDFVYTGKLFFGLHSLINNNYFEANSKIIAVHTGGLQGNNSLSKDTLIF